MIRCIRLWSGPDGSSHSRRASSTLSQGQRGDMLSDKFSTASVSFQQTNLDAKLGWHSDPARQLVITLSGALEFTMHDGPFSLRAGDILFTEETVAGDDWKLATAVPFRPVEPRSAAAGPRSRKAREATKPGAGP
jgi:hypothetical protein